MIRIRYRELPAGSHGKAESDARGTTIYLLPGLTGGQRKAALRRLRQESRRGCGPKLAAGQLAIAIAADRLRVGLRHTFAVVRLHPAGSLLPALFIGGLMTLFVLASASVGVVPAQGASGPGGTPDLIGGRSYVIGERSYAVPMPSALPRGSGSRPAGHVSSPDAGQP